MEEIVDERKDVVEKLSKKYNKKVELIQIMLNYCIEFGYDSKEGEKIIGDFYSSSYLSKTCP